MGILKKIFILFLFIFPAGVIARIGFPNGIAFTLNDLILSVLILSWLILKLKTRTFSNYSLLTSLSLFVAIGFISLLLNFSNLGIVKFLVSFSYLARFIAYSLLYFIVRDFPSNFKTRVIKYLYISGLIVVLLGYFQYFFYPSLKPFFYLGWDEHLYRMVSVFLDPNFAGAFFNIFLIFTLDYLRKNYKKFSNARLAILSVAPLLSLMAIYLTYSRSALIMLFVLSITYLLLINKKKLIAIVISILIILIFISPRAFQTEGTNLLRIVSSDERISSVQIALKVIQGNPLLGVGFNAYRYAQNKLGLDNIYWQVTHSGAGTDASFLFVLATTGVIGFISFLYMIFKVLDLARKNLGKSGIVLLTIVIALLADSIFVNSLFYVLILEWVWILAGLTERS